MYLYFLAWLLFPSPVCLVNLSVRWISVFVEFECSLNLSVRWIWVLGEFECSSIVYWLLCSLSFLSLCSFICVVNPNGLAATSGDIKICTELFVHFLVQTWPSIFLWNTILLPSGGLGRPTTTGLQSNTFYHTSVFHSAVSVPQSPLRSLHSAIMCTVNFRFVVCKMQYWNMNWPITFSKLDSFAECDWSIWNSILCFGQPTWNLRYLAVPGRNQTFIPEYNVIKNNAMHINI